MDKIVVVDLEATCWEDQIPKGEKQDIIEIGVCFYNLETNQIENPKGIFVRPTRSKVSKFCTELTSITQEQLDKEGVSLGKAFKILKQEYGTRSRIWASWGDWDRKKLKQQAYDFDLDYPFGIRHINAKTLYAVRRRLNKEIGVARALEKENLKFEGHHHRGVDDAKMIATLLGKVL